MDKFADVPTWWKVLCLPVTEFTKNPDNTWQLNKYEILRELSPGLYESAAQEVKEFNDYHILQGNSFGEVKLGRKVGSIPRLSTPMIAWKVSCIL